MLPTTMTGIIYMGLAASITITFIANRGKFYSTIESTTARKESTVESTERCCGGSADYARGDKRSAATAGAASHALSGDISRSCTIRQDVPANARYHADSD